MDFSKFWIPFLASAVIILLRNYFPKTWERLYVPFLVVGSVLTLLLVCLMLGAAYVMVFHRTFSAGKKILYCLVDAAMVGFLVWLDIAGWKKWRREHGEKK
ncbi:hypothetical protein [Flavonifractor sp. An10]|uniref:hypothetical protein n=1 Tax=Flavonifractor sp. An10 TaxID=1965537 RepID=UPI000B369EA8|nr:hypothetical protein [Flavonifractor sp. An10]OUQ83646.1 hypothetical protein B5E42_02965 [Flavonifractor sp. An10]